MNAEADILASTYNDRADVYRYQEYLADAETKEEKVLQTSALPCALSQSAKTNKSLYYTGQKGAVIYDAVLFVQPNADIKTGDYIQVTTENGTQRNYTAGEPFDFISHFEVPLHREEDA